ncbi:hypothetical protein MUK42_23410 [Musa troglodytarum]|uniref:Myb/SANT-like DNA-binding domain-containing protein n=1 Tax=Musa troglodytarum TaxID=320322 RepID=A0A9E7K9U5_9LILI|nr:hypothetical protein MUK42_23410 [Musa troglodytarum]
MKWTDGMVRLLIQVVYRVGDDGGGAGKKSSSAAAAAASASALLQKKGKWKSVSRAMMEKGFFVSPQQCEDKFNDLNKRYKRVNDLLGKGTACRVVENQSLLETMDLSPKAKEEARKLLNSKHLFFREMKAAELEEQRVAYQCRAFQLERQRFKWLRFSTNKQREMERMKLENERLRLENDRMALLLRQRELELIQGGNGGGGVSSSAEQQLMLQNTNANPNNSATTV